MDGHRLPVGVHLQAAAFDEATLLRAARMFQRATAYKTHAPVSVAGQPVT
jgi:Asp-tRNA(Asn)/Glu-tRNA(Gln) amidotransferase A subunit family amidase